MRLKHCLLLCCFILLIPAGLKAEPPSAVKEKACLEINEQHDAEETQQRFFKQAGKRKKLGKFLVKAWFKKQLKKLRIAPDHTSDCDKITFRSGTMDEVKIKEISSREIRYTKCKDPDGPIYVVPTTELQSIDLANGEQIIYNHAYAGGPGDDYYPDQSSMDGFAIASLVLSILGIYPLAFVGGLLGIVFGAIALYRIYNNPGRKGNIMAMIGMALGVVTIAGWVFFALVVGL